MKEASMNLKFSCSVAVNCLLFIILVLSVLNQSVLPLSVSQLGFTFMSGRNEESNKWPSPMEESQNFDRTNSGTETSTPTIDNKDKTETNSSLTLKEFEKPQENKSSTEKQKNTLRCDFSDRRFDICSLEGDVRLISNLSSVLLIPPPSSYPLNTTSYKIRPFTRKWENYTMSRIRELTVQQSSDQSPACDVTHDVPVLIFAIGEFDFSLFHGYSDVLIPLFVASYQYNGKIQFAVTNYNSWIKMFQPLIEKLSHYPIINLDTETLVHCFPSAQVGIKTGPGALAIDPSMSSNGYTMHDFRRFIRTSLSLERAQVEIIDNNSNKKPRLCILFRKYTRAFTNQNDIIEMAEGIGFEVVPADPETTKQFPKIAHIVNSCDVLMGLHGAGLTNLMYLPNNGTLVQILPWGNLRDIGWGDFGKPSKDMGIKYVEYEIEVEESTLIEKYPRDHIVFTNPQELHKQGWTAMYNVYLIEQNVKLDVDRFRGVLVEIFKSLTQ